RHAVSPRYLFAAVNSIVRSVRARVWHERNHPYTFSSSRRTAAEQRPCSTCPEMRRILHVPQPPPRQPKTTLAPDLRIAASTLSSAPHATTTPTGSSVIVYTPAAARRLSVTPRVRDRTRPTCRR